MRIEDLGTMAYRDTWALQEAAHNDILAGGEERLLLVEHPPVITFGRRAGVEKNLLASADELERLGVEVVPSDRGGDITFHGPGQLVVYPIVRLNDHSLSVGGYVHALEDAVMAALRPFGVEAGKDACAVGVWTDDRTGSGTTAKICAIGVRIRRGVSLHGLALNVTTDLTYFDLIVPCGLQCRPVTSMQKLLGASTPSMGEVKAAVVRELVRALSPVRDARRSVAAAQDAAPTGQSDIVLPQRA